MRDNKTGIINADKYNEYVKNQLKNKSLTPENLMKYNKFLIYDTHDKVMTPALHKSYVDKYSGSSAEELKVAMKEIDTELQERQKNNDKSLEFIQRGYEYDFITREYDTRIKQQNGERINKLRAEGGIINVINHLIDQYNNTSENEKVLKSQLETKINELKEEALKQYNVPSSKVKAPNPLNFNQVRALQDNDQILIRYQIGTNSDQEKSDGFVNISGRVTMATFNRENNNGVISLVTESGDVINLDIDKIAKDQKNDMQVYPFVPDMAKGEKALQEELDERINQLKQKELKFDDEKEIDEKKKEEEKKEKKSPVVPVQEDNQDSADTDSYDPSDMEDQELNDQFAEESFTEEQVNASTEETVETETTEQAPVEQQEEPQAPISKTEKKLSDKKIIVGQNSIAPEEKKLEEKDNKAKNRGPINNTRGRKVA
ncbi:MAG: hypothetical protein RLY43_1199, partial [Bacteroidota bacterium]